MKTCVISSILSFDFYWIHVRSPLPCYIILLNIDKIVLNQCQIHWKCKVRERDRPMTLVTLESYSQTLLVTSLSGSSLFVNSACWGNELIVSRADSTSSPSKISMPPLLKSMENLFLSSHSRKEQRGTWHKIREVIREIKALQMRKKEKRELKSCTLLNFPNYILPKIELSYI